MNKLKHYLQSIRQHSSTKTLSLEQELDAIREAHAGISSDLEKVHKELLQVREQDAQLLAELHQQLKQIDSERYRTREQIEQLTGSLADLEQYRKSTEGRVDSLLEEADHLHGGDGVEVEILDGGLEGDGLEVRGARGRNLGEGLLEQAQDILIVHRLFSEMMSLKSVQSMRRSAY